MRQQPIFALLLASSLMPVPEGDAVDVIWAESGGFLYWLRREVFWYQPSC